MTMDGAKRPPGPRTVRDVARESRELIPLVPKTLPNRRTLIVGQQRPPSNGLQLIKGFPVDFPTIARAMEAIPLISDVDRGKFYDPWLILVTPGVYTEEVRLKPFVRLAGLSPDTVFIQPPLDTEAERFAVPGDPRRAAVYLNHYSSLRNVTLIKRAESRPTDYAIWNKSTYPSVHRDRGINKADVSDIAVQDVNIMPFPAPSSERGALGSAHRVEGKSILLEGSFSTALFTNVGMASNAPSGFDVELRGRLDDGHPINADTHFIGCFFDSLFLEAGTMDPAAVAGPPIHVEPAHPHAADFAGGCVRVNACQDVHLRNSLGRLGSDWYEGASGSGVHVTNGAALRVEGAANVIVEGSSFQAPGARSDRVLDVESGCECAFLHSSTDSVRGGRNIRTHELKRSPNGTILDGET